MSFIVRMGGALTLIGAAVAVRASYDLLLMSDSDSTLGNHIDRYDPVGRAYLGSFPTSSQTPLDIAAIRQTGLVYCATGANIEAYDYSTGALVAQSTTSGSRVEASPDGSAIFVLQGASTIYKLDAATLNLLSTISLIGNTSIGDFCVSSTGSFIVADDGAGMWRAFAPGGGSATSSSAYVAGIGHSTTRQIAERPGPGTRTFRAATNSTTNWPGLFETSPGVVSSSAGTLLTASGFANEYGIVSAHQGVWTIGTTAAAPMAMRVSLQLSSGAHTASFALTQASNIGRAAIVLAPEPASLAALTCGALALVRRRRR